MNDQSKAKRGRENDVNDAPASTERAPKRRRVEEPSPTSGPPVNVLSTTFAHASDFHQGPVSVRERLLNKEISKLSLCKFQSKNALSYLDAEQRRIEREINAVYQPMAGHIVTMGSNSSKQLGDPSLKRKDANPPLIVPISTKDGFVQVAAGALHTLALANDGRVYSWGDNGESALARDGKESVPSLVVGPWQSGCSLHLSGPDNEDGQVVAVAAGGTHSLFLTTQGNVYIAGKYILPSGSRVCYVNPDGNDGASVLTNQDEKLVPVHVLLPQKAKAIFAGNGCSAVVLGDGSLFTWGIGFDGELARSATMVFPDVKGNYNLSRLVKNFPEDQSLKNMQCQFLTPKPAIYQAMARQEKKVISVACGSNHLLVVARNVRCFKTRVYGAGGCWGGQLGLGPDAPDNLHELTLIPFFDDKNIVKVAAGENFSLALDQFGNIYSFGSANKGQLGLFDDDTPPKHFEHTPRLVAFPGKCRINITDIGASDHTGIAIADNGDVYTWGFASCGATGHYDERDLGLDLDIHRPQKLELNFGGSRRVLQASGGGDHVAMIVSPAASTH